MFDNPNTILLTLTVASVFLLVLSLWIIGVMVIKARHEAREERLQRRLELLAQDQSGAGRVLRLWAEGKEAITVVPGGRGLRFMSEIEEMRRIAGIETPARMMLLGVSGIAALAVVIVLMVTGSLVVAMCAALAVYMIAWIWLKQRLAKRVQIFETQLVDALELASRSLRAGHPLQGAFRLIADEIPAPIGIVFADINQQHSLGVALDQAIRAIAEQSPSSDLKLFATSVIIQMRTGGNLADMMERLAEVIRDRLRLSRRVRVLTAQTQFSKRILLAMPFIIFVLLNLLNPAYMAPLYTTSTGHMMLLAAAMGLLLGTWIMNRLAIVKY